MITLIEDLSKEQVIRFKEKELSFKGLQIKVESIRFYTYKKFASHILGYIQSINDYEYINV